jgi:hypothetical protein
MNPLERPHFLAIGLTAAIAAGVLLGTSTVSAINPALFRGAVPPPREFVALDRPASPETPFYGRPVDRGDSMLIGAAVCPGCDPQSAVLAAGYSSHVPYFGSREERASIEARERRAIDHAYAARAPTGEPAPAHIGVGGPLDEEDESAVSGGVEGSSEPRAEPGRENEDDPPRATRGSSLT